jgi:hypothetical protein
MNIDERAKFHDGKDCKVSEKEVFFSIFQFTPLFDALQCLNEKYNP